jgi:hypothetical protein
MKPTKIPGLDEKTSYTLIPVHSVRFLLVVSNSVVESRASRRQMYGPYDTPCCGLCAWEGFRVGVFLDRSHLCHELIAHEVFHASHRVLQYQGTVFATDNHEPFALLHGWLTGHVYRELSRMDERVAIRYPNRKYLPGEEKLVARDPLE